MVLMLGQHSKPYAHDGVEGRTGEDNIYPFVASTP